MKKIREIQVFGNVAYVPLTKGYEAIIDASDVPLVCGYNWYAEINGGLVYARRDIRTIGARSNIRMHQVIMHVPPGLTPDHIDRNGLNNRRANLRPSTWQQQRLNQGRMANDRSRMLGVSWEGARGKFKASIKTLGRSRHLGYFDTAEEASAAYREERLRLHVEFGAVQ